MGIRPNRVNQADRSLLVANIPMVTTTLNRPLTILSTTLSSSASLVAALFSAQYVCSFCMPRLKRSGSVTIKLRYWSYSCEIISDVPAVAVCVAKSSNSSLLTDDKKLM